MASYITSALWCNSFNESGHNNARNNLILPRIPDRLPQTTSGHKVCDKYHEKVL
jgi:hypothetical protein